MYRVGGIDVATSGPGIPRIHTHIHKPELMYNNRSYCAHLKPIGGYQSACLNSNPSRHSDVHDKKN